MSEPIYYWVVAVVIFLFVEIISPHLVTLWFAIGAIVSLIASIYGISIKNQVVIFFVISIILLSSLRPLYVKYIKVKNIRTNVDALIGEIGVVTSKIDGQESVGLVKVKGQIWSAISEGSEKISVDERVKVLKIEGVKLIVQKV